MLSISVIIPTLNEASQIAEVLAAVRNCGPSELIVVDGGSTDDTVRNAAMADHVLAAQGGRAGQQNAGAAIATGDVLFFLHADCRPAPESWAAIRDCLADPRIVGGCFQQRIEAAGWKYRWVERGNATRVRLLKWAYGDQGIFVRRGVFADLGQFPQLPLMEDLYFMKRLKRAGRFRILSPRLKVSARRWQKTGLIRQTLRNWRLITLAHCGVSLNRLAGHYPHVREQTMENLP